MDYIAMLSREERERLCNIITGGKFKELFMKNEREFTKIKKSFRAKSLTDTMALTIAITHIEMPFLRFQINAQVDKWLVEINDSVGQCEENGMGHDGALASTMLDSLFANDIDLYFALIGQPLDDIARVKLLAKMESITLLRKKERQFADQLQTLNDENTELHDQLESVKNLTENVRLGYESKLQAVEQEHQVLISQLAEARAQIQTFQASPSMEVYNRGALFSSYDDTNTEDLPEMNSEEIASLCCVSTSGSGQKLLIRYADLSSSGNYNLFHKDENVPPYYANRDKINYKGSSEVGTYGVWTWSTIPHENDPTRDYVNSVTRLRLNPIEVVIVSDALNIDDLIKVLKAGYRYQPQSRKILLSVYLSKGKYTGILCDTKAMLTDNGKISFSDDMAEVPVYKFSESDILRLENRLTFYKKAFVGKPYRLYPLKTQMEIVKKIILSSISWKAYKARSIIRAEYNTFKEFILILPVEDIKRKIEANCHCTSTEADELLKMFIDKSWQYLDGKSLDDEVILSAINASSELQKKTKELLLSEWKAENENMLAEAHAQIVSLKNQADVAKEQLHDAEMSYKAVKNEEKCITASILEKEKLAEDVENAVAVRIQNAQKNAAEFIAQMAFSSSQPVANTPVSPANQDFPQYNVVETSANINSLDAHANWSEVLDTVIFELRGAGVAEQYISGLATFLCAAYIEKQPVLLAGPNATDICDAFSAAVTGQKHGVLNCDGDYSPQLISDLGSKGETIVVIKNILSSGWMVKVPEIIANKDIFYIATHPYAEDIQVEPKSLYGYMIPLFTEFFVDEKASGQYLGGYFADNFKPYAAPKNAQKELKILAKLPLSKMIKRNLNALVSTMHGISKTISSDDDFLFGVLPIAYATLSMNEISDALLDPQRGIDISKDLKRDLHYILGDV